MGRTIDEIEVDDVEKRKIPSKHYVYILHVTWSDQCTNVIYRRYSRFFDFQSRLMEMFPEEAGALDPSKRIIPFLPGKKFFGRSHIREVALKRMAPIGEYCKAILKLPRRISQCKDVIQFFELEPEDINPPKGRKASVKAKKISQPKPLEVYIAVTDYKKQEKGEVTLKIGMLVEIVEKTETGWWFVNVEDEQGWVPSTCLEREDGQKEDTTIKYGPGEEQQFLCTEEFRAEGEDELSMERGAVVDVIEKNLEGWWLVRYNGQEGYVPATFLIQTESVKVIKKNKPDKIIHEKLKHEKVRNEIVSENRPKKSFESSGGPQIVKSLLEVSDLLKDDSDTNTAPASRPTLTASQVESDDDVFDDDDDYEVVEEEEKIYTVQELSKILKEGKKGCVETEKVYESIQNMKSRSLTRCGSTRPPPRPSIRPGQGPLTPKSPKPPLIHCESFNTEYVTIASFSDAVGDGISFQEGQAVKVLEKNVSGWWYIEIDNTEGWAPAAYIERMEPDVSKHVEPAVNKPRVPSPLASKTTSRSREDLSNGTRSSTSESVGDLASALKGKFNITVNKIPPTPPKKDTNEDTIITGHSKPGKLQIPGGFALPSPAGVKRGADRGKQPPPPAPPADRGKQPSPPAPPIKTVSEPKPPPFVGALKPTPPKKIDTKPENKPKPNIPIKHQDKPVTDQPKLVLPEKHASESAFSKPRPPAKFKEQGHGDHERASGDLQGMTSALKARFSAMDNENDSTSKTFGFKPKSPVKSNMQDNDGPKTSNVSGIAGALKAKFEAVDSEKSDSKTHRPSSNVNFKAGLKPVQNQTKPNPPQPVQKPVFGSPGIPAKPKTSQSTPKPSWVKDHGNKSPTQENKPSWAKNKFENTTSSKPESNEDDNGTHKVSDLANVLKAKFENRQKVGDSSENENVKRDSKPLPPSKSALKPFQKPTRPTTPPSPRSSPGRKLHNVPGGRSSSPVSGGTKGPNPQKYSARPLPAEPSSPSKLNTTDKQASKPVLHKKPMSSSPSANLNRASSKDSCDSDEDSKPTGVSNLANVLKSKLGNVNTGKSEGSSNVSQSKFKQKSKQTVSHIQTSNSDVENNNVPNECPPGDNLYCAIADFAGHNPGEIKLVTGQEVELFETAEGWSYVSFRGNEGWAPSSYLEKVSPGNGGEPDNWTGSQSTGSKQTGYRVNTEFIAENEGELSVQVGQEVYIVDMPDGGWWFVQADGNEGWVPSGYIEEA